MNCTWHERDNVFAYIWQTDCGKEHITQDEVSDEFTFCPYCSKPLNLIPMADLFDEVPL